MCLLYANSTQLQIQTTTAVNKFTTLTRRKRTYATLCKQHSAASSPSLQGHRNIKLKNDRLII